jgi:hypothetical protein
MCPSAPNFFYLSNARQFHSSMGKHACYSKFMTKFIPLAWRLSTRHVITIYEVLTLAPDWKVCIAQPRSRVRNFGRNARLDAQILEMFRRNAHFRNQRRFIRASEKLLRNISSSGAHLES